MQSVLWQLSWRFYRLHPGQLLALTLSLCIGVAGFIAIVGINQNTLASFANAAQTLSGGSTHQLRGADLHFADLVRIRRAGFSRSAPVLERRVSIAQQSVPLLALDPLSELRIARVAIALAGPNAQATAMPGRLTVLASAERIARFGSVGDLRLGDKSIPFHLLPLPSNPEAKPFEAYLLADLSELYGYLPELSAPLSRIDLQLSNAEFLRLSGSEVLGKLELQQTDSQGAMLAELSQALRINLLALALLALLVACVLLSLSLRYAYLLRQGDFFKLRSLGLSSRELLRFLLMEASVLGLLGGGLGVLLGVALMKVMAAPLGQTLAMLQGKLSNELVSAPAGLAAVPSAKLVALALGVSVLAAVVGSLWPMLQAMRQSLTSAQLRASQERRTLQRWPWLLALLLVLPALLLLRQPSLVAAFAGLFFLTLSCLLPVPHLLALAVAGLRPLAARAALVPALAHALAQMSISRLAAALTALVLALATPTGLDLMVGSFKHALVSWLDRSLVGTAFITSDLPIDQRDLADLRALSGVERVHHTRHSLQRDATGPFDLMSIDTQASRLAGFEWLSGTLDPTAFIEGQGIAVSEAFAAKRGTQVGAALRVAGQARRVMGIFRDYRSEHGVVAMASSAYQKATSDHAFSSLSVLFSANDGAPSVQAWTERSEGRLKFITRAALMAGTLAVFDRTFTLTDQLKYLTALLAALGVFAALLALDLEQQSFDARLHALGASRGERYSLRMLGILGLAGLAALLALPLGVLLAKLLSEVINRRAFGWQFEVILSPAPFAIVPLLALAAATAALVAAELLRGRSASVVFAGKE